MHRKIHNVLTVVWVVKSKWRQQKPTAPTAAARLIGRGGRAAAAAAADVVGTHDVEFCFAVFLSRVRGVSTGQGKTNDDSVRNHLLTAVD